MAAGAAEQLTFNLLSPCAVWHENLLQAMLVGGAAGGVFGGVGYGIRGLLGKALAHKDIDVAGTTVYRVWGSDPKNPALPGAGPWGRSWSPVNPSTSENFRNLAGLPSGGVSGSFNTARFVSIGEIVDPSGIILRKALPLNGQVGGLLEYIIPDPQMQILLKFVGGVNPPY